MLDFLLGFFGLRVSGFKRQNKFFLYAMKIRYSVFFKHSLSYFFAICASCIVIFSQKIGQTVYNYLYEVSIKTKLFCDDVMIFHSKMLEYVAENRRLQNELKRLTFENVALQKENIYLNTLKQEMINLKHALNFVYDFEYSKTVEKVLGFEGCAYSTPMIITTGNGNIKNGMAVLSCDGVVGIVGHVGSKFASVVHIFDPKFRISVKTKSGIRLILGGDGRGIFKICEIENYQDAKLQPDELLTTSGEGCIFPKNVPVAIVDKKLMIRPVVNIYETNFVWVVSLDACTT